MTLRPPPPEDGGPAEICGLRAQEQVRQSMNRYGTALDYAQVSRKGKEGLLVSRYPPWLRKRREALGLTQSAVAECANLSPAQVHQVERGKAGSDRTVLRIKHALLAPYLRYRCERQASKRWNSAREAWPLTPQAMQDAILGIASELLSGGAPEQADLVLELVPEEERMAFLDDFFGDL